MLPRRNEKKRCPKSPPSRLRHTKDIATISLPLNYSLFLLLGSSWWHPLHMYIVAQNSISAARSFWIFLACAFNPRFIIQDMLTLHAGQHVVSSQLQSLTRGIVLSGHVCAITNDALDMLHILGIFVRVAIENRLTNVFNVVIVYL